MPLLTKDHAEILSRFENGVRLVIKAKPGSSRTREPRIVPLVENGRAVEIAVAAAPEDGNANKAILAFLAEEWGLKKDALSIKSGTSSRLKLVEILGDPAVLYAIINKWLQALPYK